MTLISMCMKTEPSKYLIYFIAAKSVESVVVIVEVKSGWQEPVVGWRRVVGMPSVCVFCP